ncbi:MAG TPA: efflux RND transporter periplasmic adaptor subunit [Psychromonas sp.]
MDSKFSWKKRLLWIPPLLLGMLALFFAPLLKQAPPQNSKAASPTVVRVIKMSPRKIQPTASGYGYIQPASEWLAQSELSGTVIWMSDNLDSGTIINKGEILLKIDPAPLLLAKAQLQAQFEVAKLKDTTIASSLEIAQQDFDLQKNELQRVERLSATGNISKTAKDASKRLFLNSEQQLQTLKNSLLINQAEQKVLTSQLAIIDLDLEKTILRAPYDIRITDVNIGIATYINRGELLLKADGLEAAEVSAQFPIGKMRPLRKTTKENRLSSNLHTELQAIVELQTADRTINWQGSVDRTGGLLDAQTQSQSIVVRIDNPYQKASPGSRPPLIRNTFVKVTLKASILNNQLLLPSTAIHNNQVYILDLDNKLQIKAVEIDFVQQQIVVIRSGLTAGDKVILSPLSPAIAGMKLKPLEDKKTLNWLDKTTGFTAEKNSKKQEAL